MGHWTMNTRKHPSWKNFEVESDPLCVRCTHPRSEHLLISCHDGLTFASICPNLTFLSRSELRTGKVKP